MVLINGLLVFSMKLEGISDNSDSFVNKIPGLLKSHFRQTKASFTLNNGPAYFINGSYLVLIVLSKKEDDDCMRKPIHTFRTVENSDDVIGLMLLLVCGISYNRRT